MSRSGELSQRRRLADSDTRVASNLLDGANLSARPLGTFSADRSNGHDPLLSVYLKDINRIPLLTREQEAELAQRIRAGDKEAEWDLTKANLRFVVSVAKKYVGRNDDFTLRDLIDEGNIGLKKAANRFDERMGFKFISYAVWWIRQSINQAIIDSPDPVRMPANVQEDRNQLGKAHHGLQGSSAHEPSNAELREQLFEDRLEVMRTRALSKTGAPPSDESISTLRKKIEHHWTDERIESIALLPHPSRTFPLDPSPDNDSEDRPLIDVIESNAILPNEELEKKSLNAAVQRALDRLSDRELKIVSLYYGFDQERSMTLEEVGQEIGLTRERIRQIRDGALDKLRRSPKQLLANLEQEWELS